MSGNLFQPVVNAFRGDQLKPTVILLLSPTLLVSWQYFGSLEQYLQIFGRGPLAIDNIWGPAVYTIAMTLVFFVLIPILFIKFVFRERLSDYGIQLGIRKRTIRSFLVCAPLIAWGGYLGSFNPEMREYYPVRLDAFTSSSVVALHVCTFIAYYIGWEFHFRGFLQFGLRPKLGPANAILIAMGLSVVFHIGTPLVETYAAIAAGIGWGILAFRTDSILSGLLQHILLGTAMQIGLCYAI